MKHWDKWKDEKQYTFWIMAGVMAGILAAAVFWGRGIWVRYKDTILENQQQQLLLTVQGVSDSLEVFIEEYKSDLLGLRLEAEKEDGLSWSEAASTDFMKNYVESHKTYVADVIVEDCQGRLLSRIGDNEIVQVTSVTDMGEGFSLRQCRMETGSYNLVLRQEAKDACTISIVIDAKAYFQSLMSNLHVGTNGYILVKDSKGIILMHPQEEQWGIQVIEGRQKLFPDKDLSSLKLLVEKQNRGETGIEEYYSYWWMKPGAPRVKKLSAYTPARLGKDFLVVSAVIDYDEVYVPVAEGFFKLALVFVTVLLAVMVMAFYLIKLSAQKRRDTEKIAYLTELNRILEELHRSEEAIAHQQRLQIMGTMTGGIAHEFNNLLTPIMGYADLLMMDFPEDSEQYDSASEIYEAAAKAKEIIQQISSLSRRNMETVYKNLNGAKVVQRALKMVRSVCPANVQLHEEICLEEECFLGNETQLNQVILNICVNAIHAIGYGEGNVTVTARSVPASQAEGQPPNGQTDWERYIQIDIADDGCGMSQEVLSQIFDPFFTTKKGGKGTGLGLALAEQIITSHKGFIKVESVPGQGSVFHLYLPAYAQAQEMGQRGEEMASRRELYLMVVDDNPKVLRLLEKGFTRLNTSLVTCGRFQEASERLKERHFDAVVAEKSVEGHSAVDFFMSVSGLYPKLVRIVIADQLTKELVEARQRGLIDACVDKPVSETAILNVLRKLNKF